MKSELEIERRWLMRKLPNIIAKESFTINQYYTPEGRFRKSTSYSETGDKDFIPVTKYYHTIKKTISHGINDEQECEITEAEFNEAIKSATKMINKLRFIHTPDKQPGWNMKLKFEVDLMLNTTYHEKYHCDLIILEVELDDINREVEFPYYIQNRIIKEITGDSSFSNFNLAQPI